MYEFSCTLIMQDVFCGARMTFDHKNLTISSLTPVNISAVILARYRVHKNRTDGQTTQAHNACGHRHVREKTMRHKKKSITPQREPIRKERKQTYMNQNDNLKTFKKK